MIKQLPVLRHLLLPLLLLLFSSKSLQAQSSCSPTLTAGLQVWLPFEETTGSVARDASGHDHTGQVTGGGWQPTTGYDGHGALQLTGTKSVFLPYAAPQLTAFTVSFWTRPQVLSDWNSFVGALLVGQPVNSDPNGYPLNGNANPWGGFVFHTAADGTVYTGTVGQASANWIVTPAGTMQAQQWQHYVFTFDQGVGSLYRNGILLASHPNMPFPQAWQGLIVGGTRVTAPCAFQGSIDDLRAYDRALSAAEVQELATCQEAVTAPVRVQASPDQTVSAGQTVNLTATADQMPSALLFDGIDDVVQVPVPSTSQPLILQDVADTFTVEAWVKPTATHELDQQAVLGTAGTSGQRYLIFPTVGVFWGNLDAGMGISVGTNGVSVYEHTGGYMPPILVWKGTLTTWTHLAVVYQGRLPSLYINGQLVARGFVNPNNYVIHPSLSFGGGGYGYYQGGVSEIRIWKTARTATQLQQSQLSISPTDADLVGDWRLREGQGSLVQDISTRHQDGQLTTGVHNDTQGHQFPASTTTGPVWLQAPANPAPLTWQWAPAAGLSAANVPNVAVTPTQNTPYTITAGSTPTDQSQATVTLTRQASYPTCPPVTLHVSPTQTTLAPGASATLQATASLTGTGVSFDGQVDRLFLPSPNQSAASLTTTLTNTFTVEGWVRPTIEHEIDNQTNWDVGGILGQRYLLFPAYGADLGPAYHVGMGISVGTNGVSVYEHTGAYMPAVLVWQGNLTGWTHIAIVYKDRIPTLYINGEFAAQGLISGFSYVHPSYEVGGGYYGAYQGDLHELRMWRTARTKEQIKGMFQTSAAGDEADLAGCWHLDEGTGSVASDATAGHQDGQLPAGHWLAAGTPPALSPVLHWSPVAGLDLTTGMKVIATPSKTTTYTVTASQAIGCSPTQAQTTITVTGAADLPPDNPSENRERNWTLERSFDGEGNEVAASKQFLDGLGRPTQAQARNAATQQVFATQTVYNSGGQPVVQTLAAPINNQSFNYKEKFVTASGDDFGPAQFEGPRANAPAAVDAVNKGTLGYYFSELNAQEPLTPITSYPYSLVEPYEGPLGGTRRAAGPGDELRMGKGRESKGRNFQLRKEFDSYLTLRPQFVPGSPVPTLQYQGMKSVSINADGRESIVVTNKEGQAIISCLSGAQYPGLPVFGFISAEATNRYDADAPAYQDIHMPAAGAQEVKFTMGSEYTQGGRVLIVNLLSQDTTSYAIKPASAGVGPEQRVMLDPGFYRFVSVTGTQSAYYEAHYGNFSYTYYDDAGRVVATLAPKDLNVTPNGMGTSVSAPIYTTRSTYDTSSRLLATESNDEGRSEYVYAQDGRIRFSQSALQRSAGRFSYSNYDEVGRVVESGEYTPGSLTFENHLTNTPAATSVLQASLLEDRTRSGGLTTASCAQRNQVWYDLPWDGTAGSLGTDSPLSGRTQEFVLGAVAKTQNDNVTTWYSYDELGRVTWVVQDIKGMGVKTLDYKYDFSGNVLEVAYQKGQADAFYHAYGYDAAQRLTTVYTSPDGTTQTLQAEYSYYLHGPLKRVQMAGDLQGVDYTYTLQGALKAINHVNQTLEPGHDAPERNGVQKDLFALTLDYFSGDYRSKAINAPSLLAGGPTAPTRYDGTIQGAAWRTAASSDLHRVAYTYDEKSQLQESQYGQWQRPKNSSNYLLNAASTNALREGGMSYDANGNMQALQRTDQKGVTTDNFSYSYKPNTNQLVAVHTGSASGVTVLDYDYDALGQMTRQGDEQGQRYFTYDVTGKTTGVYLDAAHAQPLVEYAYDDRGFRVRQTVYPAAGGPAHVTTYVRDVAGNLLALYEQATATSPAVRSEVPLYGSGRLGTFAHLNNGTDDYRYELTDHLGGARVVFHRPNTTTDVETMELSGVPSRAAFLNDDLYRVPADNAPSGQFVARLTDTQAPGQELKRVLAVTRGDTITFSALAQWKQNAATGSGATPYVLVGAAAGVNALSQRGPEGQRVYGTDNSNWLSLLATGLGFTLGQRTPFSLGSTGLEGWIKYRVLDAQGNPMLDAQGQELKGVDYLLGTGQWEYLQTGVRVPQDGTLEVMAGTSGVGEAVYFDNLRVEQMGGLIVQEQHQYAYGAPLPGLSYTVGNRRYRYGYQGQYAEHDSLTGFESFELRLYNSRIGRWMSYDPMGQYSSPYVGMGNNPVSGVDPDGGLSSSQPFLSFVSNGTGLVKGIGGLAVNWSALSPLLSSVGSAASRSAPQFALGGAMAIKNGLNAPNDIHINGLDSKGNSRRIVDVKSNLFNTTINTSIKVPNASSSPLNFDMRGFEGSVIPNAVIFTLGADFAFVGGMGGSMSYAYFLSGASKDKLYSYTTINANIGLSLGVSANISLAYATNPSTFDYTSLQGRGVTYTGSVGNFSGSYSVSYGDGKFRFLGSNADVSYRAYSGALSIPIKKPYSRFIGLSTSGIATPTLGFSVRGQAASIMIQFSKTNEGKQVHFH